MRRLLVALALLLLSAPAAAAAAARYAVVVGSNLGATGRPRLWFAERDAERFERALLELGDFSPDNVALLRGVSVARVREALRAADARIGAARSAGEHPLLVFYFSGHASAAGIELGDERLSFDELRALVAGSAADAKVAIVDACEAGLLTQVKGASPAPALDFPLPDESVRGTAFIASTAVGEAAQESAAIGGSFFTHHLEIALRGAGDADGDGRVTLGEAFRYTAAQTLAGTVATMTGAQHATYDFRMSGRGDVVLSDLRRADARLTLPRDPGTTYVLRGPAMSVLAEVAAGAKPVVLALPAGRYTVERRAPEGRARGDVVLEHGSSEVLPPLAPTRYELARAKGGPKPGLLFAGVGAATLGLPGFGVAPAARVGVRKELGPIGLRVRLDYLGKSVIDRGLRYDASSVGGAVAAFYPLNASRVLVEAGPEVGYAYASQTLQNRRAFASGVLWAGAAVMVTAPFGPLRVGLDAGLGMQGFKLDQRDVVRPAGSFGLLALWGF